MVLLALSIAVLDKLTRRTCLETDSLACHAATIGTAVHRFEVQNKRVYSAFDRDFASL
jgi:hypothetical protein